MSLPEEEKSGVLVSHAGGGALPALADHVADQNRQCSLGNYSGPHAIYLVRLA